MYGGYLEAVVRAAEVKKNPKVDDPLKLKWFTCLPCNVVQWKDVGIRSHCFCCGKWGKRGQHLG
jgi:hypothetical protein